MRARQVLGGVAVMVAAGLVAVTTAAAAPTVTRIAGESRYATAANLSAVSFDPHPDVAYVASGTVFPDALVAAAVAAKKPGPVLLVRQDAIPQAVQTELHRLRPDSIVVLGGPNAISDRVVEKLQDVNYTSGPVGRIAGVDRYDTAAKLSAAAFSPGVPVVYVATGTDYADALSGAAAAGAQGGPMLLVQSDSIPSATAAELDRLNPVAIVLLGGTNAVSSAVQTSLGAYSASVVRRAGADRYETSALISKAVFPAKTPAAYVATGGDFPDALAAGAPAAITPGPVLLVRQACMPGVIDDEITRLETASLIVMGGTVAVSDQAAARQRCSSAGDLPHTG